jgi:hypothetical protein
MHQSNNKRVNFVKLSTVMRLMLLVGAAVACLSFPAICVRAADDFAPFPPGENAALVKKRCTECHSANLVLSAQFDRELATKQYRKFVGDPDSEEGRKVIKYLITYLGEK